MNCAIPLIWADILILAPREYSAEKRLSHSLASSAVLAKELMLRKQKLSQIARAFILESMNELRSSGRKKIYVRLMIFSLCVSLCLIARGALPSSLLREKIKF